MSKLGVGIIGAGWTAGEYLKACRDNPDTEVIGMYSRTRGKAGGLMISHGVQAKEYDTLEEFMNDDRIHIVISATPQTVRPDHAVMAAERGKHIVLEKPLSLNREGVDRILEAVTRHRVKTITSFVLRWLPQFRTIRKMVDDGFLGDLIYAEADYWHPLRKIYPPYWWAVRREYNGSTFNGAGCHAVDILRYLCGEIEEVAAYSARPKLNFDFDFDPTAVAILKFTNGAIGKVSSMQEGDTPYVFNFRAFGTKGSIQNNRVYSSTWYPGNTDYYEFPTVTPDSGDVEHHPFSEEIKVLVEAIKIDTEADASIYDTYKTMAVTFAIDESADKGGIPVKVQY